MTSSDTTVPFRFHDGGGPEGQMFGGFELASELGRGGMGVVYKAVQQSLKRTVALKMLTGVVRPEDVSRFIAEAETAARLHHPNIVHIYEVGEKDKVPYFAMEFVEGGSLADRLKKDVLPPREAAQVMVTLARAVHFAHERGVVHRDLKPANVLLDPTGVPKIADFGIAKRLDSDTNPTVTGSVLGTPAYMAPEQAEGASRTVGPQADVYALGAMLYELLTGRPPFVPHESDTPIYIRVIAEPPVSPAFHRPEIPRDLEAITMMCLQKDRRDRFQTAAELADDLDRFLRDEPIKAKPPPFLRRSIKWAKRHPWLLTACLIVIAAGAFGAQRLWHWAMWEQPRIEHALLLGVRNGGIEPVGALDDDAVRRVGICVRLTRQGRRGPIVKAEVVNAKGRPATHRDLLLWDFLPTWLQGLAGAGTGTARGRETTSVEVVYRDGEAVEMIGRDRNGSVTTDVQYSREPGNPRSGLATALNEDKFNYTMPGGASHAQFERDEAGYDVGFKFFNSAGSRARNGDGVFGYVLQRNAAGMVDVLRNLDAAGGPMPNLAGQTEVRFEYNARGQTMRVRQFDANGNPVASAGIWGTDLTYDSAGNVASIRKLEAAPAAADGRGSDSRAETWYLTSFEHDGEGQITRIRYESGGPGARILSVGRIDLAYDANGFPADARWFGTDGLEFRHVESRYDERGNIVEQKTTMSHGSPRWVRQQYDARGNTPLIEELDPAGEVTARTLSAYDGRRLVRQSWERADRRPWPQNADQYGLGYTHVELRYHEHGYLVEERFSGFPDPDLVLLKSYDEYDRLTTRSWLASDKPFPGPQGWSRHAYQYLDTTPTVLAESYEDADGRPVRNSSGYSRLVYAYDPSGLLVATTWEGLDPSLDYAKVRRSIGPRGELTMVEYLDSAGRRTFGPAGYCCWRALRFDEAGTAVTVLLEGYDPARFTHDRTHLTGTWAGGRKIRDVMTYEDRDGHPAPGPDGSTGTEVEYDENQREVARILTGCRDGSGAAVWRRETGYSEDGKPRRRTRQALDAERRPIPELGHDRPSRVEETLDDDGNVSKVVRAGYAESTCGYSTIEAEFAEDRLTALVHRRADGVPVKVHAIIADISADAQKAAHDLRVGDVIVSVNGTAVANSFDFVKLGAFKGGWIEVERDGNRLKIEGFEPGRIGIGFSDRAVN